MLLTLFATVVIAYGCLRLSILKVASGKQLSKGSISRTAAYGIESIQAPLRSQAPFPSRRYLSGDVWSAKEQQ